ncbi:D-cysteine desulfhydrase family protein [Bosea sp. F3-2]|uniref:D-cysteine desulfhydrase family protein n=1 Tax=Bosea sp. F3-2 TaxID=2599640 RepID=UPI0011EFD4F9|nr:D-cysteine desulfhydrase family protein [Bosea sp. F3-2]QEL24248.1 D-cysteine desulfhydrase family protein [Bosea sp. F3-2]
MNRHDTIRLAMLPTPFERLPRLANALGGNDQAPSIWVKRDDCTGFAGGGNKARKLEYLLADALKHGADMLVTMGAIQSNHARQTAAAAARNGLDCLLLLTDSVANRGEVYRTNGNWLLDRVFGAEIRLLAASEDSSMIAMETMAGLTAQGRKPYFIPVGGSNALGSLAYRDALLELAAQAKDEGCRIDRIVLPTGSGGTHAGILAGVEQAGLPWRVHGFSVSRSSEQAQAVVSGLVNDIFGLEGRQRGVIAGLDVDDAQVGPGYGQPTSAMIEAVELVARMEGILLDPVYTGKAMAGLVSLVRSGAISPDETVVFWHTGGAPGLFAYPETFQGYSIEPKSGIHFSEKSDAITNR